MNLAPGMTPRMTDVVENVWIFRNPSAPAQCVKVKPYSVPLDKQNCAKWDDVMRAANG